MNVNVQKAAATTRAETTVPACRVCGSLRVTHVYDVPNGHSATPVINSCRCEDCGLVFVSNEFSDEELGEAYGGLQVGDYYDEIESENREKMRAAVRNLERVAKPDDRIIDIGTGNGEFLKVLLDSGFQRVAGHEIPGADLEGVRPDVEAIYHDYDYSSVPSGAFDVVTLLDVVEHVRDPRFLLAQCFRMLRPGGYVYFHTPVVTRTDRLMHRFARLPIASTVARTWLRGRTSIFHLQNYSRPSIAHLLQNSGFELTSFTIKNELSWPTSMYVRVYVTDRLGLPRVSSKLLVPFVYPFIATSFFNANKSIVLARKPVRSA